MENATQPLLVEILQDIPEDAIHTYEVDSFHHKHIPYGKICRDVLREMQRLEKENQMLEKLVELNMEDFWDIVDQRDWYYSEYQRLKKLIK